MDESRSLSAGLAKVPGDASLTQVESLLRDARAPGATVAVFLNGRLAVNAGVGQARHNSGEVLKPEARFYVYSITKSLLAIATLKLYERGRIDLDEPVNAYLKSFPLDARVTIRQVLNHTAGLPDYGAMPEYKQAVRTMPGTPWSPDEFFALSNARRLLFEPGHGWSYSNVGYIIVKHLLEQVSQCRLGDVLDDLVFGPLELDSTFVTESLEDGRALTPGYSSMLSLDGMLADIVKVYHPGWVAHGVVVSTAEEIARIFEALFTAKLISAESLAAMLHPVSVGVSHPEFVQPAYGLGLMIDTGVSQTLLAGHTGEGPGYSAAAFHLGGPEGPSITSVALANRDAPGLGMRIALTMARSLAGSPS